MSGFSKTTVEADSTIEQLKKLIMTPLFKFLANSVPGAAAVKSFAKSNSAIDSIDSWFMNSINNNHLEKKKSTNP